MSTPNASASPEPGPEPRRLVNAWVAEQVGRLDSAEASALNAEWPQWRAQAAQLIAEGLLAYVVLEMVAPDLAIAQAQAQARGSHANGTDGHAHGHTDDAALTERLVAHLQDFIDYRDEVTDRGGLPTSEPCPHGHDHHH
ncbi:hypothetical protein CKO31_01440 [Thiohalocapsa halophila]|uniref:Uncharacterized protein n=1 Tax=Thiohalocapsa halophila TaxID=69359 RepID=A0ABS1CC01_9GAMM|nr:hypothetical protein [Thiohalocapsa halophila]MBK1629419.1 hypothetical protein [Thiohalocapsa halophila]